MNRLSIFFIVMIQAATVSAADDSIPFDGDLLVHSTYHSNPPPCFSDIIFEDPVESGDAFDWAASSPLDLLEFLRSRRPFYTVRNCHPGFVREEHLRDLVNLLDSGEPCANVMSGASSFIDWHASTVGNEAAYLIRGFQTGTYPPHLNSTSPPLDKDAIREWWVERSQSRVFEASESEYDLAFKLVIADVGESVVVSVYRTGEIRLSLGGEPQWARLDDQELNTLELILGSSGFQYTFSTDQILGNQQPCCHSTVYGVATERSGESIDVTRFDAANWFSPDVYMPPDLVVLIRFVNTVCENHFGDAWQSIPVPHASKSTKL